MVLKGRWYYLEHECIAEQGSYAREPASETHTLYVPEDVTEMITWFHVTGGHWSRVWQPVMDHLACAGFRAIAVDFPGFGRSGGEPTVDNGSIPALADWVRSFLQALGIDEPVFQAAHDIGGGVAQQVLVDAKVRVARLALVNAVMFDSWPVPGVARFSDSAVAAATTHEDVLAARRKSVTTALGRPADEEDIAAYLEPWQDVRVATIVAGAGGRRRQPLYDRAGPAVTGFADA